jgi:predicted RNA-binding Zn-ribbon protein involved in translation (DUF1610 family)
MNYPIRSIDWREQKLKVDMKKKQKKVALCPSCKTKVICEGEPGKKFLLSCPTCGQEVIVLFAEEEKKLEKIEGKKTRVDLKRNEKNAQRQRIYYFLVNQPDFIIIIVGIIVITIGIAFLLNPPPLTLKTSFTLIFIGYLLFFMVSESFKPNRINDSSLKKNTDLITKTRLFMPEIITLSIIIWTFFLFTITSDTDFGIFFVCIFLGILAINELTDRFTTIQFNKRMNMYIIFFLIGTVIIIAQKIITL